MDDLEQWWTSMDPDSWPDPYDLTPAEVEADIARVEQIRALLLAARGLADTTCRLPLVEDLDEVIAWVDDDIRNEGARLLAVKARDGAT